MSTASTRRLKPSRHCIAGINIKLVHSTFCKCEDYCLFMQSTSKLQQLKHTSSTNTHYQMRLDLRCFFLPTQRKGNTNKEWYFSFQGPPFYLKTSFPRLWQFQRKRWEGSIWLQAQPELTVRGLLSRQ